MAESIKQVVGVDCSKDTLDASYGVVLNDFTQQIQEPSRFTNDSKGINKLISWTEKRRVKDLEIVFVVEATGVYHELLVNMLNEKSCKVAVVLPNRTSSFFKTTTTRTITDAECAKMITQFGLEKQLELWKKPKDIYRQLKQLTRERVQLIDQRTITKNQLHAEQSGADPLQNSVKRMKQLIKLLDQQIDDITDEIKELVASDSDLKERIDNICTTPGIALITAATLVGETAGFDLIRNKKQLVSYAGLDVVEKQSGTSVRGKKHISHRGNKHLRKALYFPAFTAIRSHEFYKGHYANLVSRHGVKMKAAVSVQRKMLVMAYTLWKKNTSFDPNYYKKESGQQLLATPTKLAQGRS